MQIYHRTMKLIYIGTNIPAEAHHELRILAAKEGESVSSLLKRLSLDYVAKAAKPRDKPRSTKAK